MVAIFTHNGPIYKHDNTPVYMNTNKVARGTSVASTVKALYRHMYGRGLFIALIYNHAGDTKYRAILKNCMNLIQNIKCNGRSYPLRLMSPIIVKQLRVSKNVLLTLRLLSEIKISGLNIWLISFHAQIISFNMQLVWCALIQTICTTILRL